MSMMQEIHDEDTLEKARQGIMRLRELLDITRLHLDEGEAIYAELFAELTPDQLALKEKERQREAAHHVLHDPATIKRAVTHMQFHARDLERAFEDLYNIISNT